MSPLFVRQYWRGGWSAADLLLQRKYGKKLPDNVPLSEACWQNPPDKYSPSDKSPLTQAPLKRITRIPFSTIVNFCNLIFLYQYIRKLFSLHWDYLCYLIYNVIFIIYMLLVFNNAYLIKSNDVGDSTKNLFHRHSCRSFVLCFTHVFGGCPRLSWSIAVEDRTHSFWRASINLQTEGMWPSSWAKPWF